MNFKKLFISFFLVLSMTACRSYKNIPYLTDISDSANMYRQGTEVAAASESIYHIASGDILKVNIFTKDGRNSLIASGGNDVDNSSSAMAALSGISGKAPSQDGYKVDEDGRIDVPSVGKIQVGGLKLSQARDLIRQKSLHTFNDPVVNVDVLNFKVTVLGEVNKPGTYVTDGQAISVFDALGLAGDMTIYGKRENVMLMRRTKGNRYHIQRFDLNNSHTLASKDFFLQQGDIVYVEPSKGKAAATDMASIRTIGILSSLTSLLITLIYRIGN